MQELLLVVAKHQKVARPPFPFGTGKSKHPFEHSDLVLLTMNKR
jgi:hypothetical protein